MLGDAYLRFTPEGVTRTGQTALPASMLPKQANLCKMVGLYYSASILAGRADPFVLPPCRPTASPKEGLQGGYLSGLLALPASASVALAIYSVL